MKRCVTIRILLIKVSLFINQRLYDRYLELDNSEMHWAAEDSSTEVHICSTIYQALSCLIMFLPDGQAQRRAAIFVEEICVGFVHQEAFYHAGVTHDCCLMQRSPLPIVSLIFVKVIIRVILQKGNEGTFIHFVFLKKVAQNHERLKDLRAFFRFSGDVLRFWRLGIDEPFKWKFFEIR